MHDYLGGGGQGSVWSAKPAKTKRSPARALKVCFAEDSQGRARFVQEVELLRRCDSPYVLKVYDADLDWKEHVTGLPAFAFYVAEKCQGSLEHRRSDLGDHRRRLALFRQACRAVTHLHSLDAPIIHRDIKPANFLISSDRNDLVLADFGIARPLADSRLTETFEVVGTPYYRAYEVSNGHRGSVRSDVYSLGRLLEWLMTRDVSRELGPLPVPRGGELDDEACNILDRIIAKATQVDPAQRFDSVQAMLDHLPDLWLSVRPRPKSSAPVASATPNDVLSATLELARSGNTFGWRELEGQLRRDSFERLVKWPIEVQPTHKMSKEDFFWLTDTLVDAVEPRLVLILGAAYADHSSVHYMRRLVEDLTAIPGWRRDGWTSVVEAPRTLIYIAHYLHGALCCAHQQLEQALQAAEISVESANGEREAPLWKHSDLTGYPVLLGGNSSWGWEYLCELPQRRPALSQLFSVPSDLELGLASYSLALSLLELASDAAAAVTPNLETAHGLHVAPMVVRMPREAVIGASKRVSKDARAVTLIADRQGASVAKMRQLWPAWKSLMAKYRVDGYRHWQDLPLGDLAVG